jgi:hypothetical protein
MISYLASLAEEEEKINSGGEDRWDNCDTDRLFLLYVLNQSMTNYVVFDGEVSYPFPNNVYGRAGNPRKAIDYWDCEPATGVDGKGLKEAIEATAFEIPLTQYPDFLMFFFDFLVAVEDRISIDTRMKASYAYDAREKFNFPVNYRYFDKLIVDMIPQEWAILNRSGKKQVMLKLTPLHTISDLDKRPPTDGFFRDRPSKFGEHYVTKNEAIRLHREWLDGAKEYIAKQKDAVKFHEDRMKSQGFPYTSSYEEYCRFLLTNLKDMKFGRFTLSAQDILNIFIPYPLR